MLNEYRGKNDTLRGLARNKDIATLMRNAVDSPIGSTHRKRVGSVLNVLKKANLAGDTGGTQNLLDGAGGPGVPEVPPNYNNFTVFPAAPPMNGPGNVDWKNEMNNGAGFYYGTPGQTAPSSPSTALSNPPVGYHPGVIQKAAGGVVDYAKSGNFWTSGGSDVPAKTIGNVAGGAQWFGSRFLSGLANVKDWAIGGPNTPLKGPTDFGNTWGGQVVSGLNAPTEQPAAVTGTAAAAGKMGPFQVQTPVKTGGITSTPKGGGTPSGGTPETGGTPIGGSTVGGTPTGGSTTGSTPTGGTQNAPSTSSNILTSALKNNLGPTAFAIKAQSDPQGVKQLMKDVAGIDIPDENLPSGKLLSAQINDIEVALKGKYNLDGLLREKNSMISSGITVERDLQAYIRGRDEYLNQTQKMIDDAEENFWKGNPTAPGVAKDTENYVNYLYTLRGQQNQNYVGFINSSLDQYHKELTDVTNNYDTALTNVQHDLTAKTAITQEEYTKWNIMLQEMYNNAEAAPGKKLAADALYQQLHPTALNTIADGIGNLKSNVYSKDMADLKGQLLYDGGAGDSRNGQLADNIDSIVNTINRYAPNGGQSTISIVDTITRGMQKSIDGAKDPNSAQTLAEKYLGMIKDFKDHGGDDPNTVAQANQMAESVAKAFKPQLSTLLEAPQNIGGLRNAINSASKNSFFQFGQKSLPSRDQFVKSNTGLDPKVADLLYTWMSGYMRDYNITDARNIQSDIPGPDGTPKMIKDLSDKELTDFVGRTIGAQMFASYGTTQPE